MPMTAIPPLHPGTVIVQTGHGERFHTANANAWSTNCGRRLPARAETIAEPAGLPYIEAMCRVCAGRHLVLAQMLGIVAP